MSASRAERRLTAILAADVVGYSRLMGKDEQGTLDRLKTHRRKFIDPLIAEHRGRIVKLMGDGALVEFPSVVDAVACAVAIQEGMGGRELDLPEVDRIRFRIGVNLGDVIVEGDDIYGDGVNVAARLEGLAEPGGVCVSGKVREELRKRLELGFAPLGRQRVKNIAEPVEAWRVVPGGAAPGRGPSHAPMAWRRPLAVGIAVLLLAAGGVGGLWYWARGAATGARPAIAVLPLDNLGGDEATGRLADGITEDIITDLARVREFDVIARNSTEVYKGKPVDVRQIGRELDVGYVLEGSIQRPGDRVRVTAQLIDARTGAHVWTDRWDRPAADVFAVQAEVVERTANALSRALWSDVLTAAKRKRPTDLAAYEEALLGNYSSDSSQAVTEQALAHCEAAISKAPDFAPGYICKAWRLWHLAQYKENYNETFATMAQLAREAIQRDPYSAWAHLTLGWAGSGLDRNPEWLAATERALELAPSSADILNMAADALPWFGQPERATELCDRSFRLNPGSPFWYYMNCITGYSMTGRYKDAVDVSDRVRDQLNPMLFVWRAASLAALGRHEELSATDDELRRRAPEVSFEYLLNNGWLFARQHDQDQTLALVRKAGVRICATEEELKPSPSPIRLPECDAERAKVAAAKS